MVDMELKILMISQAQAFSADLNMSYAYNYNLVSWNGAKGMNALCS